MTKLVYAFRYKLMYAFRYKLMYAFRYKLVHGCAVGSRCVPDYDISGP